jgi:predicted MPP superfamily phosphohydrolase
VAPRKRPSIAQFTRFLRGLTLFAMPPTAIALLELGRRFGPIFAALFTLSSLSLVLYGIGLRVRLGFDDVPRAAWIGRLAMPVFDMVWCTCLFSPVTTGITALLALPLSMKMPQVLALAPIVELGTLLALSASAYGVFVRRRWVRLRRLEVSIAGLPPALDGYRIAHLSDLHIGSIDRASNGRAWADKCNALSPDLVAVTGDLLSTGHHFHDEVVEVLGSLQGRDGVFACLGNHDYYQEGALCDRLASSGVRVLRNEGVILALGERGEDLLFVAGVEDLWRGTVDLDAALSGRPEGVTSLLLSHNPGLFPAAARQGVSLTLSGHVHAGQIAVPFLTERWSLGRLSSPYSAGLFERGVARLFVHAGLGTTGPAIRFGAAPEIVEIVLRQATPAPH